MKALLDTPAERTQAGVRPGTVRELLAERRVAVRTSGRGRSELVHARLLELGGYRPSEGDRVLVTFDDDGDAYVTGVLHAARPPQLCRADGTRVELAGEVFELRDADDRLLFRYADGDAEIVAPRRDLKLVAPHGRVTLQAGTDVSIEAARDVSCQATRRAALGSRQTQLSLDPRRAELVASKVQVLAQESQVESAKATLVARSIAVTAEKLAHNVEHWELRADKIVERARESLRDVRELAQTTAGRARALVHGLYSLRTGRTSLLSREETSIDGERILLG
jgi:hypothetical protein